MPEAEAGQVDRARVLWQCRRGMLELDLLLLPFVEQHYHRLSDREKEALLILLAYPDQQLLAFLMGHGVPHDRDVAHVAEQIRTSAGT